MGKTLSYEEYVLIDFKTNDFRFCNLELIILSKDNYLVTFHYGKLGNKGTRNSYKIKTSKSANDKIKEKKKEILYKGYTIKDDTKKLLELNQYDKKSTINTFCDGCKQKMDFPTYYSIEKWARYHANWDYSTHSKGYKKVFCIDCQKKNNLFKKRFDESGKVVENEKK